MLEWFSQFGGTELWVMFGLTLLLFELLIPAFYIGSFGVSAFAAATVAALGADLPWQITTFGVLGTALVIPARKFFLKQSPELLMSVDALEGAEALCVEPINGTEPGTVRVGGSNWTATTDELTRIAADEPVLIIQRDGAKLVVAPMP